MHRRSGSATLSKAPGRPSGPLVGELQWSARIRGSVGILTRVDGSEDLPANRQSWCWIRVSREDPRYSSVVPWVAGRKSGGDEETRTPDPLLAKEMLSQLSYVPLPTIKR